MSRITVRPFDGFLLVVVPFSVSILDVKTFIMGNLRQLMKNDIIWDIRGFTALQEDSKFIWPILEEVKMFPNPKHNKKIAIVASIEEQLNTALKDIITTLGDHHYTPHLEFFEHLDSAIEWVQPKS